MNVSTQKKKIKLLNKRVALFSLLLGIVGFQANAQCAAGETPVKIQSSGGNYPGEKWVSVTTEPDGGGTIVWQQSNYGTGGLINQTICLVPGVYYVNAYDQYADGWDSTSLTVSSYEVNYSGFPVVPNNNVDADGATSWEPVSGGPNPNELEGSYMITVLPPPTCFPPTNLLNPSSTYTTANLTWEGVSGQTGNYELKYGAVGFNIDAATAISVTGTSYTITDVSGNYEFVVRQVCNGDDPSSWSSRKAFRIKLAGEDCSAPIDITSLPYTTTDNTANYTDNPNIEGSPGASGCGSINGYLNGNDVVYKYTSTINGSLKVTLSALLATYSGIFVYNSCSDIGVNCIAGVANSGSENRVFELPVTIGEDYYFVISTWASPQTVGYTLTIEEMLCAAPSSVTTTEVTAVSALSSWSGLTDTAYEINYGTGTFAAGAGEFTVSSTVGTNTYEFTGLSNSTAYRYFIRKNCGANGYSDWVGPFTFTTLCNPIGAFTESFDAVDTGSSSNLTKPACWSSLATGSGYGYVSTTYAASPTKSYYLSNNSDNSGSTLLISPVTEDLGNGTMRVKFKARAGGNNYTVQFGTMASNTVAATFTQLQSFTLTTTFQEFTVVLPAGTDDFFAFKHGNGGTYRSIYIDDVIYEAIPPCPEATDLGYTQLGLTSAELNWVSDGDQFQVVYGVTGFDYTTETPISVSGTSYVLTDLIENQQYQYYVRRDCSATDDGYSIWAGPFSFKVGYCDSVPTSLDGQGITNVTVGETSIPVSDITYYFHQDLVDAVIGENTGSITFNTFGGYSSYTYNAHIWIDLNNDGVFDNNTELLYSGESAAVSPAVLTTTFTIPNVAEGEYRMRIGSADSGQATPNPCYSGTYGVTVDLLLNVISTCETPAPTGDANQTLEQGQTLADLVVTGQDLTWYSDAALTTEIPATTAPTSGNTYYVTQTIDACESATALAITVDVTLSNNSLDIVDLKVYPNPTSDVLNIDYKEVISKVTIFDINGRQVGVYELNATTNTIPVQSLSSGTYLLKVQTEANETSIVKFVKK